MASKLSKTITKVGTAFNKIRAKTEPTGIKYLLLENNGTTGEFRRIYDITECTHEYDEFRQQTNIKIATESLPFQKALFRASHAAIGTGPYLVYPINNRDIVGPDIKRPWWDIYCVVEDRIFDYEG